MFRLQCVAQCWPDCPAGKTTLYSIDRPLLCTVHTVQSWHTTATYCTHCTVLTGHCYVLYTLYSDDIPLLRTVHTVQYWQATAMYCTHLYIVITLKATGDWTNVTLTQVVWLYEIYDVLLVLLPKHFVGFVDGKKVHLHRCHCHPWSFEPTELQKGNQLDNW